MTAQNATAAAEAINVNSGASVSDEMLASIASGNSSLFTGNNSQVADSGQTYSDASYYDGNARPDLAGTDSTDANGNDFYYDSSGSMRHFDLDIGTTVQPTGVQPATAITDQVGGNESLAATPLSIAPLSNDDFAPPSFVADGLAQAGAANIPIDIGSAEEGEGGNETIKQVGENAEALATGTEGVGKAVDLNGVIAKLSGLKPLEELLDNTAHVLAPLANTFNFVARGARIAAAPSGDGAAQAAGEVSDFALNDAVDALGATVGAGIGAGVVLTIGAAVAAPVEAGLLIGAIVGGVGANYLYGTSTAPGFLRRFYYSPNGAPSAQRLPPEQ